MAQEKYKKGLWNVVVKVLFYLNNGMDFVNRYRNLAYTVFGLCLVLKITSLKIIIIISAIALVVIGVVGWINANHVERRLEYLSVQRSTHFNKHGVTLQEKQLKALNRIAGIDDSEKDYEYITPNTPPEDISGPPEPLRHRKKPDHINLAGGE